MIYYEKLNDHDEKNWFYIDRSYQLRDRRL